MTGHWPPAELPGLYVDLGAWNHKARTWIQLPSADYRCGCGYQASASGDAVPHFVATARTHHKTVCPITTQQRKAA